MGKFVSFRYDAKNGRGVLVLREDTYIKELKEMALEVSSTNAQTGKVTQYRAWSPDEKEMPDHPKPEKNLILFRIDYWDFPQGVSEDEMKTHLKENYFDNIDMQEGRDWNMKQVYTAPYKPKPHLAVMKISDRFLDLITKKQREYQQRHRHP